MAEIYVMSGKYRINGRKLGRDLKDLTLAAAVSSFQVPH